MQATYEATATASATSPTTKAIDQKAETPRFYSGSEIAAMLTRPTTAAQLLKNLKLVWDKQLLMQPAFFEDSNLLKCFDGAEIHWKKVAAIDASVRTRNGKILVSNQIFHHLAVEIFQVQEQVEETKTISGLVPPHEHDVAEIMIDMGVERPNLRSRGVQLRTYLAPMPQTWV